MDNDRSNLADARKLYARQMAAASLSEDPRLERAFASVPREAFLPPGPWRLMTDDRLFDTPNADPIHLYRNALVTLDAARGINSGEPFLHAAWLGKMAPQPGETVARIGAGTGYYTAILATLCGPGGHVSAYEIDAGLAAAARRNLAALAQVRVVHADASAGTLPACDLVYVNAGVAAPPLAWLEALRSGGRMMVPWQPSPSLGLTLLVSPNGSGFSVEPTMSTAFIPCVGASSLEGCIKQPGRRAAWSARSAWLTKDRAPDRTAVAIYPHVWFSSAPVA